MKESAETREIVERFLERLDEVVESSSLAIWEDVGSYSRLGDDFKDDVRSAVRENVAILAHILGVGKDVVRADLEPIERVGARRAEAGIPLEDVLHAYRIVSRVCWGPLVGMPWRRPSTSQRPCSATPITSTQVLPTPMRRLRGRSSESRRGLGESS